jgi:hypothetical protein
MVGDRARMNEPSVASISTAGGPGLCSRDALATANPEQLLLRRRALLNRPQTGFDWESVELLRAVWNIASGYLTNTILSI